MRTWELSAAKSGGLTLVDRPSRPAGSGEVRVAIRAASLNYRDLLVRKRAEAAGRVPLSDGAGEVVEVGAGVTRWKVGDRVMANFFPHWVSGELTQADHDSALGGGVDGVLRDEVVLPAHSWVRAPAGYSYEEAASLPCAGLTAWQALFEGGDGLQPGQTVLLQGSGGVSVFALQLAKAAGARVFITSKGTAKQARLRQLGADEVIDYAAEPRWGERARDLTGGRGVDRVVDVAGVASFDQSMAALRSGGTARLVGVLTGITGAVNLAPVLQKRLEVRGVYVGSVPMFERLVQALEVAPFRPVVDRVFEVDALGEAYAHLEAAAHVGKVVVRLGR